MAAFIEILITLAALLALCLFVHVKTGLASGAAPLASVHLLLLAGFLWFAAALAAAVWLWRHRKMLRWREILSPAFVFFVLASLAVLVLFAARRPVFNEWDEFSFWGIAAKVVKTENQLEWVGRMNNIRACVKEIVENEIIYA